MVDREIEVVVLSKKDDLFIIEAKTGSILETFTIWTSAFTSIYKKKTHKNR